MKREALSSVLKRTISTSPHPNSAIVQRLFCEAFDAELGVNPDSSSTIGERMNMKVDQSSDVESAGLKMAGASTASTSSPKVSMFAKKSGFVIPKNKLSGSLVPIFRGNKKLGGGDTASEESGKQGQRKTKWGPDLTQDAAVRRARALAYQTRVDQITKQLGSGMEIDENLESPSAVQQPGETSSHHVPDSESTKLLELEKREAIGEILKLNASFKAPPDYKPLLKEDRVLISVKEYPGYNFIGLIFGPGGDNRKRLEKETGAKIQVYAVKSGTRDKGEIISADGNDFQGSYEEINVHISADTYEKVDAAVSVIELLVTSVSGNLVAASTTSASSPAESKNVPSYFNTSSANAVTITSQGHLEDFRGPQQTAQQVQFQYSNPWFANAPLNAPANQFPGFIPSPNASAPGLNNPGHQMPSLFGPRPVPPAAFNSLSQSPSLIPPRQNLSSQYMQNSVMMHPSGSGPPPRTFTLYSQASAPPVHSAHIPFSVSSSQPRPPAIPSYPQLTANAAGPQSGGPSNMRQVGPPPVPTSMNLQPNIASSAPITNASAGNTSVISGSTYSSGQSSLQSMAMSGSRPAGVPMFSSMPPPMPIQSANSTQGALVPRMTMNPFPGSLPNPSPVPSGSPALSFQSAPGTFTGNVPNFTPIRSPANAAPGPHRPNFGDFTFQPQPQHPQSSHPFSGPGVQTHVPQPTSFRPPMHDPQPVTPVLRPSMGAQAPRPQGGPSPMPFPGDPSRFHSFPVMGPARVPHMGPRNMNPAAQLPDLAGSFPSRPGNPIEVQRAFHGQMNQPPRPHFTHGPSAFPGRPALGPGGRQTYDPFSPTSASKAPHQHGGNPAIGKRQENDPEYEDLMASVGVK